MSVDYLDIIKQMAQDPRPGAALARLGEAPLAGSTGMRLGEPGFGSATRLGEGGFDSPLQLSSGGFPDMVSALRSMAEPFSFANNALARARKKEQDIQDHRPGAQAGQVGQAAAGGAAFLGWAQTQAQAALRAAGLPENLAPILAGIAANETGYGASAPSNNFFGIKGPGTGPLATREVVNGQSVPVQASFRAYGSSQDSFNDFVRLIQTDPNYANARAVLAGGGSPEDFARAVHAGGPRGPYATDPDWANKVISIAAQARTAPAVTRAQTINGMENARLASTTGYAFPVQGYQGQIALHHGSVRGGSDIMAPEGTPVVAMRGGTVAAAGSSGPGGNWVQIQGDDGNQYYYAHLRDAPLVQRGVVQVGQPLGFVGRTGNAATTPAHLHIGIGPSIQVGVGPLGGTGGDYDAISLLQQALQGR